MSALVCIRVRVGECDMLCLVKCSFLVKRAHSSNGTGVFKSNLPTVYQLGSVQPFLKKSEA
jgi:hypothetical protein